MNNWNDFNDFEDSGIWVNSEDPDQTAEQSDQSPHCFPYRHQFQNIAKLNMFKFWIVTKMLVGRIFRVLTVLPINEDLWEVLIISVKVTVIAIKG